MCFSVTAANHFSFFPLLMTTEKTQLFFSSVGGSLKFSAYQRG